MSKAKGQFLNFAAIMFYRSPKKQNITPLAPRCKKKIYNTSGDALDMIRHIKETRNVREINVYKCNICGFWHLTSRSE